MGVIQEITLLVSKASIAALNRQLDEASRTLQQTVEKAIDAGGADTKARAAAIAKVRALKTELDRESRALAAAVAQGLLGAKEAAQLGMDAGRAYGDAMAKELQRIQKAGVLSKTDLAVVAKQVGQQSGLGRSLFDLAPPDDAPFRGFFDRIKSMALGVGGAIAGVFALGKLKDFARDSIREFLKDANDLDNLRSTVQGLGGDFDALRPQIEDAADAFARAGRGSAGDFQRILTQLLLTSGDYQQSLKNVTLVSDLAVARQISLEQATRLVGSAMDGQAGRLKQFGIHVAAGADAVQALRDQVGGFVERQGPSWTRALTAATNVWNDLKSAIGEALLTAGGGTSTLDTLIGVIQGLTKYVRENRDVFRDLGTVVVQVAGFLARDLVGSLEDARGAIQSTKIEWALLTLGARNFSAGIAEAAGWLRRFGAATIAVWAEIKARAGFNPVETLVVADSWRQMGDALIAEAKRTRDEAAAAWQQAKDANRAFFDPSSQAQGAPAGGLRVFTGTDRNVQDGTFTPPVPPKRPPSDDTGEDTERPKKQDFGPVDMEHVGFQAGSGLAGALKAAGVPDDIIQEILEGEDRKAKRQQVEDAKGILDIKRPSDDPMQQLVPDQDAVERWFADFFGEDFHAAVSDAADYIGDEFGAVFQRLFTDGENLQDLFGNLGKGFAAGLLKEISSLASAKAKENIAAAIEETAKGFGALFLNPAEAGAHFKSAGLHAASAVAWSLLGGAAAAGGNALSQTGAAAGGGDLGRGENERLQPGGRGQATIYIQGGDFLNLGDRQQMDQFAKAMELVSGYDVVIKRGAA